MQRPCGPNSLHLYWCHPAALKGLLQLNSRVPDPVLGKEIPLPPKSLAHYLL